MFKGWYTRTTIFYVALCLDCGGVGVDPQPIPFLNKKDADTWYSAHAQGTGHQIECVTEVRVDT